MYGKQYSTEDLHFINSVKLKIDITDVHCRKRGVSKQWASAK